MSPVERHGHVPSCVERLETVDELGVSIPPTCDDGDVEGAAEGELPTVESGPERLALERLGDGVVDAARFADVEEGEDAGVRQGRDRTGLVLEAGEGASVLRYLVGEYLDRYLAAEPRVPSPANTTHGRCVRLRCSTVASAIRRVSHAL
jgi:hypothetical protein